MKDWKCYLLIAAILALCYVCNDYRDENRQLIDAHHDYVRRTELKQAAIDARLATLERIGINMHIMTHSDENIIWVEVAK
jgi:hypothetical protein